MADSIDIGEAVLSVDEHRFGTFFAGQRREEFRHIEAAVPQKNTTPNQQRRIFSAI